MRHNSLEDIGVIEINRAIAKELDWIFRPQPVADVGIDAIVEQKENGDPKGKFLAVQIKSGEGNFHFGHEKFTYYVSNVHHNYWLSLNIPLILCAYLPETDNCFWQEISAKTLRATKTQWKIVIPMSNLLDSTSKKKLETILVEFRTKDVFSEALSAGAESDAEILQQTEFLVESIIASSNINQLIDEFRSHSRESTEKNRVLANAGHTIESPDVAAVLRAETKRFVVMSRRLENEARIFAETFVAEIITIERFLHLAAGKGVIMPTDGKEQIRKMPAKLESAIRGIDELRSTVESVRINSRIMKKARKPMLTALDLLHSEYSGARVMVLKLVAAIA